MKGKRQTASSREEQDVLLTSSRSAWGERYTELESCAAGAVPDNEERPHDDSFGFRIRSSSMHQHVGSGVNPFHTPPPRASIQPATPFFYKSYNESIEVLIVKKGPEKLSAEQFAPSSGGTRWTRFE